MKWPCLSSPSSKPHDRSDNNSRYSLSTSSGRNTPRTTPPDNRKTGTMESQTTWGTKGRPTSAAYQDDPLPQCVRGARSRASEKRSGSKNRDTVRKVRIAFRLTLNGKSWSPSNRIVNLVHDHRPHPRRALPLGKLGQMPAINRYRIPNALLSCQNLVMKR